MEKGKLIESIRQLILKQNPTQDSLKHVHYLAVSVEVDKAHDTLRKQWFLNNKNLMESDLEYYSKDYIVDVQDDGYGGKYSDLPVKPISLPRGIGLVSATPEKGEIDFIRTTKGELKTLKNLPIFCCLGKVFYYKEGETVQYSYARKEYMFVEKVNLKIIPQSDELSDEDDIDLPMGEEPLVQLVLQLMGIRPTDNTNDDVK